MSAPDIPSVEDRVTEIEQTLALVIMLTRALSTADDLGLDPKTEQAAWSALDKATTRALDDLRALACALPDRITVSPAPEVTP